LATRFGTCLVRTRSRVRAFEPSRQLGLKSGLPFEQNIVQTRKAVEAIKSINPAILVEGEIDWFGASSEILEKAPEGVGVLTTPEEAKQFVDTTKIDVLAPAVGNMHGLLQSMVHGEAEKRLDIQRIAEIRAAMTIVHVNTELRLAWRRGLENVLQAHPGEVARYKLLPEVVEGVAEVVRKRLRLFNLR
jgi:fructose-bisphosphate aldolase, class II